MINGEASRGHENFHPGPSARQQAFCDFFNLESLPAPKSVQEIRRTVSEHKQKTDIDFGRLY